MLSFACIRFLLDAAVCLMDSSIFLVGSSCLAAAAFSASLSCVAWAVNRLSNAVLDSS